MVSEALRKNPLNTSVCETRDSNARARTDGMAYFFTRKIHQICPDLTPNQVTVFGTALVLAGVSMAEENTLNNSPSFSQHLSSLCLEAFGYVCDRVDGTLARVVNEESPGKHNSFIGQLYDVTADRAQEIGAALLRARTAHVKGNKLGEYLALAVAATTTLPSLARACVESKGFVVPETGNNHFQTMGTRVGRIVLNTIATHLREVKGVPVQVIIDALAVAANLSTTYSRLAVLRDPNIFPSLNKTPQGQEKMLEAKARCRLLLGIEGAALAAIPLAVQSYSGSCQSDQI